MGFLKQDAPVVDYEEWSKGTRAEKIVPMARHWAEVGFGTPVVLHLFYVVKILLYVLAAWLIVLTTKGIDGFTNVTAWYARADRVRKGRALHDAVRGRRSRMRIRPPEQQVLPAAGIDPVLVAAQHHSAATMAEPDSADQGHGTHAYRRAAVRGTAGDACARVVLRRHRADFGARHHGRRAADVADLDDPRPACRGSACATK